VKVCAQRHRHWLIAIPAQLDNLGLAPGQAQRGRKAGGAGAGMKDHVRLILRLLGHGECHPQRLRQCLPLRLDIDQLHARTRRANRKIGHQCADHACPDHAHLRAHPHRHIPERVDGRLQIGCEHRAAWVRTRRHRHQRSRRYLKKILMRMQAIDPLARQWTVLGHADGAITILDRPRKIASLKRAAHPLMFHWRHLAVEHQPFSATADRTVARTHPHLIRCRRRQGFRAQLGSAWLGDPQGGGLSGVKHSHWPDHSRTTCPRPGGNAGSADASHRIVPAPARS